MNRPLLPDVEPTKGTKTPIAERYERSSARLLSELGPYESVRRFARKYGNGRTRTLYLESLKGYFAWLRGQGVQLSPDAMVEDNLKAVYESKATDVTTKRRHLEYLDRYVNDYLLKKGLRERTRLARYAAVSQFYERNDSPLFGDFEVSREEAIQPAAPLLTSDIRSVLKALPVSDRTPLLLEWQSSVEVNRVLGFRWGLFEEALSGQGPACVRLYGRKRHKQGYSTFVGRDSVESLKVYRAGWVGKFGREPGADDLIFIGKRGGVDASWLNDVLKRTAARLKREGLIENGNPRSWHSHSLRHSFSTECSHANVKPEVREYWMGHISGVAYVYQHPELHEEDMVREYRKVEPFLSLNQTETTLRGEFEEERMSWVKEIQELKRQVARLAESSPQAGPGAQES
jgi:integrase